MKENLTKNQQEEFEDRLLEIRRVVRVTAGGKRFRFEAIVVLGNKTGKVGVGIGKANDVARAIEKARNNAKKNLIVIPLKENRTIPYEIEAKFSAARVRLKPAKKGHGLIAGGAVRVICQLGGIKDISAKILSHTKNQLTNALATIEALKKIR
ncbi:30S ribosomal protein S5 [bacterium]|nr:30S ribosomal protein S5 [bacterium]